MDNIDEVTVLKMGNELKESQIKVYRCSICVYQTPVKYYLFNHKKIHLAPEERQMFACEHCGNKYTSKRSLISHLDINHSDSSIRAKALKKSQKKIHRCSKCGFQTPYQASLHRHQKIHLAREKRQLFACAHCDNKYTTKLWLRCHLENNHIDLRAKTFKESQKKIYRCSKCGFQTPYHPNLHRHKKIHLAREDRQLEELQKKVYKCSTCSYQTTSKSNFNSHKKTHLAPEERQMFACLHCDKTYTRKGRLQCHLRNNHIDLSYQTTSKSNFNSHKKTHLVPEERQMFVCLHCDKTYTRKGRLQCHLRNNHIDLRNSDCTSVTDEVMLDTLKIEIEDSAPLTDEFRNTECLFATNEIKSEDFLKLEPDDVAPIQHKDLQDDFKNAENLSVAKKVKLEDFIKMEPNDDSPFLDEDAFFKDIQFF
ncbi:gastrula zinc finger protein XlCGF57.1-like isoform X4 [Sitophilus oryzae]|uniref:Gastrula zinc finger protein XlCGF57.1-like isoform X4 n=1 Tax=Sitophilus oryzae TaxID=7048 RepID=A0A6J2XXJ2_SITOR|nr:gastrula zinc finger protein XlCGF57.1-like isoform X4 [Sitophilus oryzae]